MYHLTIRGKFSQPLCFDLHYATLRRTRRPDDLLLEATTPTISPYLALRWAVDNQLARPTRSSTTFYFTPEYLKIDVSSDGTAYGLILSVSTIFHHAGFASGQSPISMLCELLDVSVIVCDFLVPFNGASSSLCSCCCTTLGATFKLGVISPAKPAHAVIPKSSCSTLSGIRNRNLNRFAESVAGLITLCLCFTPINATRIAHEATGKLDVVRLLPQSDNGNINLTRRDTSTHDAQWRAMVIGSTIGSTAGAAILGIGIYLLFRARRKRRTADLPRSESQPIEMQPTRSSRAIPSNVTQTPHSRPPPRAQAHDTSGGPSSWVAKTPRTPSLASLELQPRLLHPRDINRATQIRESTGSQFTEHFEPVVRDGRPSGGPFAGEHGQPSGVASRQFQGNNDPQGSGQYVEPNTTSTPEQPYERLSRPRSDSAPLPPGAAAPIESVGNYSPPEASNTQNSRIQLS